MKRRTVLLSSVAAGGALVLGWGLLPVRQRLHGQRPLLADKGEHGLNGWVKVGSDDLVTVALAKSEMGQGVSTALAMLLADEMDADWTRVRTAQAPVDPIYNNLSGAVDGLPFHPDDTGWVRQAAEWLTAKAMREVGLMVTGGSSSVKDLWLPMRQAGAAARAMLVAAAAETWAVPVEECQADHGEVKHLASGRQLRFGALAEAAARQSVPRAVVLKKPNQFTLIGRPLPRQDAAAKQDGSAVFGIDMVQPGMLYASAVMCPTLGGAVASYDDKAALALPGVRRVLAVPGRQGGTAAVVAVADTPWHAIRAVRAVVVQWQHGQAATWGSDVMQDMLAQALNGEPGHAFVDRGEPDTLLQRASRTVKADYQAPLLAHATLEPQNCTVLFDPLARLALVWAPTQVPTLARRAVAQVLDLDAEQVELRVTLLGGGFGRRLETDFIAQAAAVAQAMPGVPVQTFWTRDQDTTHDLYRPPCAARWQAALDGEGRLLAVVAQSAGPSVVQQFLQRQFDLPAAVPDKTTAEGAFDQAYEWPALRVSHRVVELPVPVGFWRSVGHSHQAFFKESFVDECAHAAGRDPLDYRLQLLLQHPRHRAVLQRAATMAGWGRSAALAPDGARTAWGLALHESFGSIVAQAAQVSVDPADARRIRVHRVVAAIDCGTAVNPNLVRQQMESAVVFGLSAALYGQITLRDGQVQQTNFHDAPLLRLVDCPQIDTDILPSNAPPEGVGEPGTPPIAPAVANALFALTGQRLRRLPLALA
jgi:isoquinoline 1-oxidoreductase subunit beta